MGFRPVRRTAERTYPTAQQAELAERLSALAELPPARTAPYLTISLDWRPSGADPEVRPALQRFEHEAHRLHQMYWPRGPVYGSLGADIERIRQWLSREVDPSSHGVFVVANHSIEVFETVELGLPLETRVAAGSVPALKALACLDEDHPTYAVLLADQQQASVSLIAQSRRIEALTLTSADYPRKQQSGGWSQRRFQQRADERLMALAREIAAESEQYLRDRGVDELIIAGDEVITGSLERTMSDSLRSTVIAMIRLDIDATEREILDATIPIATAAERDRELAAVTNVRDRIGAGNGAVGGSADVLEALAAGRVWELVLNEDFHEDGWADFDNGRYGVGALADVFGTGEIAFEAFPIDIEEEMIRLAILSGASIDVIHTSVPVRTQDDGAIPDGGEIPRSEAARELDNHGGVAALLRY